MTAPSAPEPPTTRYRVGCALIVLGAAVLLVGLLILEEGAKGWLAAVVAPAVALVAAGAALTA